MTPKEIITLVSEYYGTTEADVSSKCRKEIFCVPRHVSAYFLWHYYGKRKRFLHGFSEGLTLKQIGELLGKKDHATIIHSKKVVANMCDTDKSFRQTIELINEQIRERMERN